MLTLMILMGMRGWGRNRIKRLVPLLSDQEQFFEHADTAMFKSIYARYSICRVSGHLWEIEEILFGEEGEQAVYISKCARCFPHIHSRRTFATYNLFAYTMKEPSE